MQRIQRKNDKKGIGRNGSLSYKKEMISKVTTKPQPFMLEKVSFSGGKKLLWSDSRNSGI